MAKARKPDGSKYASVRRRWLPWRMRTELESAPAPSLGGLLEIPVVGVILFILALPLYVLAVLLFLVWLVELLALLIAWPFVAVARLFGAPVTVYTHFAGGRGGRHERVNGWFAAGRRRDEIVAELEEDARREAMYPPAPQHGAPPVGPPHQQPHMGHPPQQPPMH